MLKLLCSLLRLLLHELLLGLKLPLEVLCVLLLLSILPRLMLVQSFPMLNPGAGLPKLACMLPLLLVPDFNEAKFRETLGDFPREMLFTIV